MSFSMSIPATHSERLGSPIGLRIPAEGERRRTRRRISRSASARASGYAALPGGEGAHGRAAG
eukprot:5630687-Prymnesium_polylepis.1